MLNKLLLMCWSALNVNGYKAAVQPRFAILPSGITTKNRRHRTIEHHQNRDVCKSVVYYRGGGGGAVRSKRRGGGWSVTLPCCRLAGIQLCSLARANMFPTYKARARWGQVAIREEICSDPNKKKKKKRSGLMGTGDCTFNGEDRFVLKSSVQSSAVLSKGRKWKVKIKSIEKRFL